MITSEWYTPGADISLAMDIRKEIFQNEFLWAPEKDSDGMDPYSYHMVLKLNDVPVAVGRIRYYNPSTVLLDRIGVLQKYRHQGIGDGLVKILDYKASCLGFKKSAVYCPIGLEPFFKRIGFSSDKSGTTRNDIDTEFMLKETNDGSRENCSNKCSCT